MTELVDAADVPEEQRVGGRRDLVGVAHPALRQEASLVQRVPSDWLNRLVGDLERMLGRRVGGMVALGVAAPQVGVSARVFVLRFLDHAVVNPEVVKASADTVTVEERCLTLGAHVRVPVGRSKRIKVRYHDQAGTVRTVKFHGTQARAFLHELDHLNGVLITDYL